MNKLKVIELFAGIGAVRKALSRCGYDFEIVDAVEIDKYAVASYNEIYGDNIEPTDIQNYHPPKDCEIDLIWNSSPCQDISLAGKNAGASEGSGTRSSLIYEAIRVIDEARPKYVIWENVKNLISKKHKFILDDYINRLNEFGYTSYYQVLNSKDFGIPQNRERVFVVSIRNDLNQSYTFPEKQELKLKLKDMLEENVDEKYYLSDKMINYVSATGTENYHNKDSKINLDIARPLTTDPNKRAGTTNYLSDDLPDNCDLTEVVRKYGVFDKEGEKHQAGSVYDENGIAPTLDTMQGGYRQPCIEIKNATKTGYLEAYDGDGVDISSRMIYHRGNVQRDSIQTITTSGGNDRGVVIKSDTPKVQTIGNYMPSNHHASRIVDNNGLAPTVTENHGTVTATMVQLRIRKLTPKECWKLMGFDGEDADKASRVNSNTQLYKQAGNSVVVNVIEALLKQLIEKGD